MRSYDLVFSAKPALRLARHLGFWLAWWMYFGLTYYYYLQVGMQTIVFEKVSTFFFLKTFVLVLVHALACYFFIYDLLPSFLFSKKYFRIISGLILIIAFLLTAGYLVHVVVFPLIDHTYHYKIAGNNTIGWTNINSGLLNGPKVIAAATAIKLLKQWYLKQKEKEQLEKEKLITDLQLMKAQIRPDLLFNSLDQIYKAAEIKSQEAPGMLIQLADLLSYLLYECDKIKVPLEKELKMMKEYIILEKARHTKALEVEVVMKGDYENKQIAPLLLLPFIENSFKHSSQQLEQPWINLEFRLEENTLSMKLLNGIVASTGEGYTSSNEIQTVEKRLRLLYPQKYELKEYVEDEILFVMLKIHVGEQSVKGSSILIGEKKQKQDYVFH